MKITEMAVTAKIMDGTVLMMSSMLLGFLWLVCFVLVVCLVFSFRMNSS